MTTTILLFHPHLDQSRVNKALVQATDTTVRDMYALYPDGKIDVAAEQAVLSQTDRIVWQFPLYWYSSPSLLKKWEDLVLTYGWAYGPNGNALYGKELQLVVTVGGKQADYQVGHNQGYPIDVFLRPFFQAGAYTGMKVLKPFLVFGTFNLSDADLSEAAAKYRRVVEWAVL